MEGSGLKLGPATNALSINGVLEDMVDALQQHHFDDWYIALLSAAMDRTDDISLAVRAATTAYQRKPTVENTRFAFHSDPDKIQMFQEWLRQQLDATLRSKSEEQLWQKYIDEGFKRGAGRSFDDVRKSALYQDSQEKLDFYNGSREEFLRSAFAQPESVEKVKLLAGRSFDDLENVTADMSTRMSRTLTDGLVQGMHPKQVAKLMAENVDLALDRAEDIAQTEFIRAHASGQLLALKNLGVDKVGVAVEFSTAEDGNVCPKCGALQGIVLTLDEAEGVIPVHVGCRCAFIPADVGEDEEDQIRDKDEIEDALAEAGLDIDISPVRPQSILNAELLEFSRLSRQLV